MAKQATDAGERARKAWETRRANAAAREAVAARVAVGAVADEAGDAQAAAQRKPSLLSKHAFLTDVFAPKECAHCGRRAAAHPAPVKARKVKA